MVTVGVAAQTEPQKKKVVTHTIKNQHRTTTCSGLAGANTTVLMIVAGIGLQAVVMATSGDGHAGQVIRITVILWLELTMITAIAGLDMTQGTIL